MAMPWRARNFAKLLLLTVTVSAAACLSKRTAPVAAPVAPLTSVASKDTTRKDSAAARRTIDSMARALKKTAAKDTILADSLEKLRIADSIKTAKPVAKTPSKKTATKECLLDMTESPPETRATYQRQSDSSSNMMPAFVRVIPLPNLRAKRSSRSTI